MKRIGFGQVEPNHLSAQRNGQVYGQLPANKDIAILENGQFVKYDYAAGEVNFTGDGEWMLVLNEVKLYDDDYRYFKNGAGVYAAYAMKKEDFVSEEMTPRVLKTNVGDLFTTNTLGDGTADVAIVPLSEKPNQYLTVGADGYLALADAKPESGMAWKVVKVYTMPDGQEGVKIQRIQ